MARVVTALLLLKLSNLHLLNRSQLRTGLTMSKVERFADQFA